MENLVQIYLNKVKIIFDFEEINYNRNKIHNV